MRGRFIKSWWLINISVNAGIMLCWSWSPMDPQICPFGRSFGKFLACKRFPDLSWSWCQSRRNTIGFIWWLMMCSRMSQYFTMFLRSLSNFARVWGLLIRVSTYNQLWHSVMPTLMLTYTSHLKGCIHMCVCVHAGVRAWFRILNRFSNVLVMCIH